jgi:UDP-glucose 4-epimerase
MRILVTGANGFIGAWTLRRLLQCGHTAVALDLGPPGPLVQQLLGGEVTQVEWHLGDVSQYEQVVSALAGCDRVVHLAGVLTPFCQARPVRGAAINLVGTLHVFDAARQLGLKSVVYASSAGVYGPLQADFPEPTTHYGAFKLAAEGCARAFWHDAGLASLGLRPFVVYGPGRETGGSAGISLACEAAVHGRPYTIPFTGRAGLVYVEDVVDLVLAGCSADLEGARVINVVGDVQTPDEAIAEIRRHLPGARLDAVGEPLPLSPDIPPGDTSFLSAAWHVTPLSEGIARTLAFYR